jgi:diguanylate cyclase (GGDEF)-like protein/PAS domain S-box-containing protein
MEPRSSHPEPPPVPGAAEPRVPLEGLAMLVSVISELVVVTGAGGEIVEVNRAAEESFGLSREELLGRAALDLVHPEDRASAYEAAVSGEPGRRVAIRVMHKSGGWRWLEWTGYRDGAFGYAVARDVTEERNLAQKALYDELTGLANRALLLDHLKGALARLRRSDDKLVAAVFIDLDDFKLVNDRQGHRAGDELLVVVAEQLRATTRAADVVARFGGDEFVIVAEGMTSEHEALRVGERVLEALSHEFELARHQIRVSCSIGIAVTHDYQTPPDLLLREADVAMYRAKARGRGCIELFDERVRLEVTERLEIEQQLRAALHTDQFGLLYQPVISIADGALISCEALVRWHHPALGLVTPDRFIPLAESTGLIVELGARILDAACRQAADWAKAGHEFTVSVNVSRRQLLEPGFVDVVAATLDLTAVPPERIWLEISETSSPARVNRIVDVLQQLRSLGVSVALDDFGAGYSTLNELRGLPLDVIKVDRSFTARLLDGGADRAILAAVIALGRELRLAVVAEGVETEAQLAALAEIGCLYAQGFLMAPGLSAERLPGHRFEPG